MSTPAEFARLWNSWDLNQQLNWLSYSNNGNPPQAQVDDAVTKWVTNHYGASAAYLSNPEIGPILLKAAREGWTDSQLQAAMEGTAFWKSTTDSQRKFDLQRATDPATASKLVTEMISQIQNLVATEGVQTQFTPQQVSDLATQLVRNGVPAADIPKQVMAQVQYNPTHPVGKLGSDMDAIQKQAGDYMVPLSDSAAFTWARNIASGTADINGAQDYIHQLALGAFPQFTQQLQAGLTTKQVVDPYIQQTAKLLEKAPDMVDLTSAKFQPIINSRDPKTNAPTAMSLADAAKFVRGLDDYQTTSDAKAQAATVSEQLGKAMGAV